MTPSSTPRLLFVQPFGLGGNGGGARILMSMIRGQPFEKRSICTEPNPSVAPNWIDEHHLPIRPALGRLDRSRFAGLGDMLEIATRPFFERSLAREIEKWQPNVVHVIPHAANDFHLAWQMARTRGCRVVMSAHDDLEYLLPKRHPFRKKALQMLGEVWRDVDQVFVISQELGEEYSARYGKRSFEIITDGLQNVPDHPTALVEGRLHVYFMGLFHYDYRENLRALTRALARLKSERPEIEISLSMRCEHLEKGIDVAFPAHVLPFADQATVLNDMKQADLLYLPLPFGERFRAFTRYSLSTKMVSYLGSGIPILYHGPAESAAGRLLMRHQAALHCHSLDELALLATLKSINDVKVRSSTVEQALDLARTSFPLEGLRRKFLKGLLPG